MKPAHCLFLSQNLLLHVRLWFYIVRLMTVVIRSFHKSTSFLSLLTGRLQPAITLSPNLAVTHVQ